MATRKRAWNDQAKAVLCLRVGLAVVFAYAAIDAFRHPLDWTYFIPHFMTHTVSAATILHAVSVLQLIIAALLVVGVWLRVAAAAIVALLLGIVILNMSSFSIIFRDVGLAAAALALLFLAGPKK
jgi:uncharacterized membrane protein YphA (DoxX/SURF4 family)